MRRFTRRTKYVLSVAAACSGLWLGSVSNSVASGSRQCGSSKGRNIDATSRARLYERGGVLYGCAFKERKVIVLGRRAEDPCDSSSGCSGLRLPRLAGKWAAYDRATATRYVESTRIEVRSLTSGKVRHRWEAGYTDASVTVAAATTDLVLTERGSIAWITGISRPDNIGGFSSTQEVRKSDGGGSGVVDSGADVAEGSLRLCGSAISWIRAGERRTAPLN